MIENHYSVIGLGSIGLRHARNLIDLGLEVYGFDPDEERCSLLKDYGGKVSFSRETAIKNAKAVVICTPSQFHHDDLKYSIENNCHVFMEKPFSHTMDGIEKIFKAANENNLVIFHGYFLRFHPCVLRALEIIEQGHLGEPLWARSLMSGYLPNWRPHQDYRTGYTANLESGGALFDCIHEFDLLHILLGPAEVMSCIAGNSGMIDIPTEDHADVILRHVNGAQSSLHVDYLTRPSKRSTEIAGSKGFLQIDLLNRHLQFVDISGEVVIDDKFSGKYDDDYVAEISSFQKCIKGDERPGCTNEQAANVLEQVLAARYLSGLHTND